MAVHIPSNKVLPNKVLRLYTVYRLRDQTKGHLHWTQTTELKLSVLAIDKPHRAPLNQDYLPLCPPVQVSCRRGLSKPHERTVSCGEERRRWRLGEEVSGRCIQTWNDLTERTQVRLWQTQASCCCINGCFITICHEWLIDNIGSWTVAE